MKTKGLIFDIHRFSLNDGPGIRTTIFLKGCVLDCLWCHNPESKSNKPQLSFDPSRNENRTIGEYVDSDHVLKIVLKDKEYYDNSGGGVTISGGEPLSQFEFTKELLIKLRENGIRTCIETCGAASTRKFEQLLPLTDLFLFDYKATGDETHRELTGAGNKNILSNLDFLYKNNANIILRCPLVPGINDSAEHLQAIARLNENYPHLTGLEIMPYHNIGNDKTLRLGQAIPPALTDLPTASEEMKSQWLNTLHGLGCSIAMVS